MANAYRQQLSSFVVLSTNLKPHLDEFPNLRDSHLEFETLVNAGVAMVARQRQLNAEVRDLIDRRNTLLLRAGHVREFLVSGLREKLGPSSQRLVEFEVLPRGRRRTPPAEPPADPPVGDMLAPPAPLQSPEA